MKEHAMNLVHAVFLCDTDLFLLFHLSLVLRSQVFSYLCLSTNNLEYSNFLAPYVLYRHVFVRN